MRLALIFVTTFLYTAVLAQDHPTSFSMGCCSNMTGLDIYSEDPALKKDYLMIYLTNKYEEKSIFYYGKNDPWKAPQNKKNSIYDQDYIVPPNSLPIAEGVYMDQSEVANIHWQEFLFFIQKDSGKYADKAYQPMMENKFMTRYYLSSEFYYFPVVGMDFEHAQSYCQWRAKELNKGIKEMLKTERNKYKYIGRLPTLEEWKQAAGPPSLEIHEASSKVDKGALEYLKNDLVDMRLAPEETLRATVFEGYNVNLKRDSPNAFESEIPHYIYGFESNTAGFYNLFGNVKEFVQEGYAIGGSFKTVYSEANNESLFNANDEVASYKMDIGFRCVCEIKKY